MTSQEIKRGLDELDLKRPVHPCAIPLWEIAYQLALMNEKNQDSNRLRGELAAANQHVKILRDQFDKLADPAGVKRVLLDALKDATERFADMADIIEAGGPADAGFLKASAIRYRKVILTVDPTFPEHQNFATTSTQNKEEVERCSFCGKDSSIFPIVRKERGVSICEECVQVCQFEIDKNNDKLADPEQGKRDAETEPGEKGEALAIAHDVILRTMHMSSTKRMAAVIADAMIAYAQQR